MSALILMAGFLVADVTSGLQVGDKLGDFKALGFSGPQADKEFQFLTETKGKATLVIFVQKITRRRCNSCGPWTTTRPSKKAERPHHLADGRQRRQGRNQGVS